MNSIIVWRYQHSPKSVWSSRLFSGHGPSVTVGVAVHSLDDRDKNSGNDAARKTAIIEIEASVDIADTERRRGMHKPGSDAPMPPEATRNWC